MVLGGGAVETKRLAFGLSIEGYLRSTLGPKIAVIPLVHLYEGGVREETSRRSKRSGTPRIANDGM